MARVGILTGGGDCPGLNAVIRARRAPRACSRPATAWSASATAGRVRCRATRSSSRWRTPRGILPRGGTILGTSRTNPYKEEGGASKVLEVLDAHGVDALIAVGGEDTLGVARRLAEDGRERGRRAQDDRQRPQRHRLHLRLPHRRADRHRRHRPAAHHRRVAQPGDGRRGDGPPRRLDRHLQRHGRRGRRHPRARAPVRPRRGVPAHPAPPRRGADVLDHRRVRGRHAAGRRWPARRAGGRRVRPRPPRRHCGGAGASDRGAHGLREPDDDPRSRPAWRHPDGLRPRAGHPLRRRRRSTP